MPMRSLHHQSKQPQTVEELEAARKAAQKLAQKQKSSASKSKSKSTTKGDK